MMSKCSQKLPTESLFVHENLELLNIFQPVEEHSDESQRPHMLNGFRDFPEVIRVGHNLKVVLINRKEC